jgi:hypothetical protein
VNGGDKEREEKEERKGEGKVFKKVVLRMG